MTATTAWDLVSADLRGEWGGLGYYPGRDFYDMFAGHRHADPGRTAVIDDDGELSYADLDALALSFAAGLAQRGIGPGEIVATQLPNGRFACAADLAIAAVGAVALPFPVGRDSRDARSLLGRSAAAAAIVAPDHVLGVQALRSVLPGLRHLVTPAELFGYNGFTPVRPDPDGPARVLVSSGSEAEPKMVLYSHNALLGGRGAFVGRLIPPGTRLRALFLVPLASSFGSNGTMITLARHGGTLVLQSRFDPARTLELMGRARPTHVFGVPTMFRMMVDHPDLTRTDLAHLKAVALGGAPLDPATAESCRAAFGCAVINVYGSADGVNCTTALDDPPSRCATAGRPNPAVARIRIVDDALNPLPRGSVGEIVARGPMTPMRYLGDDSLNERYRTADGWVRTGDLGVIDVDGYLTVAGRRKDIVIRGGVNISPAEVEQAIAAHPAVRDVACVGVPDRLLGERLCACIVSTQDMSLPELSEYLCAAGLARHKHPEHLLRLDALPLSPAGKVAKDVLRGLAAG
ncbi:MAG: class I adenylate-forming enzyme family protein [Kibdelosporangium sp.]